MKNLFCVYSTDAWKSHENQKLVAVCTTPRQLKKVLNLGILRQEFQFDPNSDENNTPAKQAKAFRQAWDKATCGAANVPYRVIDRLEYCFIETIVPNNCYWP